MKQKNVSRHSELGITCAKNEAAVILALDVFKFCVYFRIHQSAVCSQRVVKFRRRY